MENPFYDSLVTKYRKIPKNTSKKERLENRVVSKARSLDSLRTSHVHETFNIFCFSSSLYRKVYDNNKIYDKNTNNFSKHHVIIIIINI